MDWRQYIDPISYEDLCQRQLDAKDVIQTTSRSKKPKMDFSTVFAETAHLSGWSDHVATPNLENMGLP